MLVRAIGDLPNFLKLLRKKRCWCAFLAVASIWLDQNKLLVIFIPRILSFKRCNFLHLSGDSFHMHTAFWRCTYPGSDQQCKCPKLVIFLFYCKCLILLHANVLSDLILRDIYIYIAMSRKYPLPQSDWSASCGILIMFGHVCVALGSNFTVGLHQHETGKGQRQHRNEKNKQKTSRIQRHQFKCYWRFENCEWNGVEKIGTPWSERSQPDCNKSCL